MNDLFVIDCMRIKIKPLGTEIIGTTALGIYSFTVNKKKTPLRTSKINYKSIYRKQIQLETINIIA